MDASAYLPARLSLSALRRAARGCHGCPLYRGATQTVFGAGKRRARVVLVGEQPGNEEDLTGAPFVGPAGKLLDRALAEAGVDRDATYVTNVVKHFKFERRGKARIHRKPNAMEMRACRPWLDAELALVKPTVLVCLGATAAQALLGRAFRVSVQHGKVLRTPHAEHAVATMHPSAVLRQTSSAERAAAMRELVADLRVVARLLGDA